MESLFFNTPNQCYKISNSLNTNSSIIKKVDISNGILFYDIIKNQKKRILEFNYIDKMLFFVMVVDGCIEIAYSSKIKRIKKDKIETFLNINNPFNIVIYKDTKAFILFVSDFFLKRYLSFKDGEPIDYIYNKMQSGSKLLTLSQNPLDAYSIYLANRIKDINSSENMQSIKCMYKTLEFIVRSLSNLDIIDKSINLDEQTIAKRAKDILHKNYIYAPTIKELAKLCATNECKLKKSFKKVYKNTIYGYIQELRLKRANLLLKEEHLSIKEVANAVGYSHSGYFAKLFFRRYGIYPKDINR